MRFPLLLSTLLLSPSALAQPAPGSCAPGTAQATLDGNAVTAELFNTGSLFFGNGSEAAYVVEGTSAIFAANVWFGGIVDGEVRTAGGAYSNFEFWPGPLGDDGRPIDPTDCSAYDRIYTVSRSDLAAYEGGGAPVADLADWPVALGAPVLDGDGTPGNYDLAAGDRPDLKGGAQAAFWVMNDVGNQHGSTQSEPLGIEVRVLAVAPQTGDERLDQATVYHYEITNRSPLPIEEMRATVWADIDLGNYADDYMGTDTTHHMAYVYNAYDYDARGYGLAPPAVGAVLLSDELFSSWYGTSSGIPALTNPAGRFEYYNVMQGLTPPGTPITVGGRRESTLLTRRRGTPTRAIPSPGRGGAGSQRGCLRTSCASWHR